MIFGAGSDPTANNPVPFSPPASAGRNYMPGLPGVGFYSDNLQPFTMVTERVSSFPAYRPPLNPNAGPHPMPPIQSAPAAAPAAPAPGPTPAGTNGAFGGSGFGSSGGVRSHMHVDPYNVMRNGNIPGVSPSGSNIRSGYQNAGRRVQNSMPFQQPSFYPVVIPSPPPPPPPAPAATHGFGGSGLGSWWNPLTWFRKSPSHAEMVAAQAHGFGRPWGHRGGRVHMRRMHPVSAGYSSEMNNCEWVGPRLDGMYVRICNGAVVAMRDANGNVQAYPQGF